MRPNLAECRSSVRISRGSNHASTLHECGTNFRWRRQHMMGAARQYANISHSSSSSSSSSIIMSHHFDVKNIHSDRIEPYNLSIRNFTTKVGKRDVDPVVLRKSIRTFLEEVQAEKVPQATIQQKAEQFLQQLQRVVIKVEDMETTSKLVEEIVSCVSDAKQYQTFPMVFAMAIQIIRKTGHPKRSDECYRLLSQLLGDHQRYFARSMAVNSQHVNDALFQWAMEVSMNQTKTNKRRMNDILRRATELFQAKNIPVTMDTYGQHAVITNHCIHDRPDRAFNILRDAFSSNTSTAISDADMSPIITSFSLIISTFGQHAKPKKASEVMNWMLDKSQDGSGVPPPNTLCFNSLLSAWSRSRSKDAGVQAERIIDWMENLSEGSRRLDTKPDDMSYSTCANAWNKADTSDSPVKTEAILKKMIKFHEDGHTIGPTESAFCATMGAWSRSKEPDAVKKVESLLKLAEDTAAMTKRFEMTLFPYSILISAWGRKVAEVRGKKHKYKCADSALKVLFDMKAKGVSPDATVVNSILKVLKEANPLHAMVFFLEAEAMFRLDPTNPPLDTRSFNSALNTLAANNTVDTAEQAFGILSRMQEYSQTNQSVKPDGVTFNLVLKVLSGSRALDVAVRAETVLKQMEEMPNIRPDSITFMSIIIAWGRETSEEKFENVRKLIQKFHGKYLSRTASRQHNIKPFNAGLSVCSHNTSTAMNGEALELALEIMDMLRRQDDVKPDEFTFVTLFRIIEQFSEPGNIDAIMQREFDYCKQNGLVSRQILREIHRMSPQTYTTITKNDSDPSNFAIPMAWSRSLQRS